MFVHLCHMKHNKIRLFERYRSRPPGGERVSLYTIIIHTLTDSQNTRGHRHTKTFKIIWDKQNDFWVTEETVVY